MHAVDEEELHAYRERRLPPAKQFRDGVWTVPLTLPGTSLTTSFAYLIVDDRGKGHLIDAGWALPANVTRIRAVLRAAGLNDGDLVQIVATHLHPDHLGGAELVRSFTGASVTLLDQEERSRQAAHAEFGDRIARVEEQLRRWRVPADEKQVLIQAAAEQTPPSAFPVDRLVVDGGHLAIGDGALEVIHTPGHTWGHICLADHDRKLLFTGDHLLPTVLPAVGTGGPGEGNPLKAYLGSLSKLEQYDGYEVCPGHGYRFLGLSERIRGIERRHRTRSEQIASLVRRDPDASIWQIAERVEWSAGWKNVIGAHRLSALAQTETHLLAVTEQEPDRESKAPR